MTQEERAKFAVDKANHVRAEHRKACKLLAVTIVAVGSFVGVVLGYHYHGLGLEILGLYLVELV